MNETSNRLPEKVTALRECRQSFENDGGDEAFKWWLVSGGLINEASADKIVELLDAVGDDAWTDELLEELERALD
jgi:hypothetical protein